MEKVVGIAACVRCRWGRGGLRLGCWMVEPVKNSLDAIKQQNCKKQPYEDVEKGRQGARDDQRQAGQNRDYIEEPDDSYTARA